MSTAVGGICAGSGPGHECPCGGDVRELEWRLVRHCSPTLAGMKCGSMFRVCGRFGDVEGILGDVEGRIGRHGVSSKILVSDGCGSLLYFYRRDLLEARLADPEVRTFLKSLGYGGGDADSLLDELAKRFGSGDMPHEVGVFLDYPLEDVRGYMRNAGRMSSDIGCWKVYGDGADARRRFEAYRRCRDDCIRRFSEGCRLESLAERRSEPGVEGLLLAAV